MNMMEADRTRTMLIRKPKMTTFDSPMNNGIAGNPININVTESSTMPPVIDNSFLLISFLADRMSAMTSIPTEKAPSMIPSWIEDISLTVKTKYGMATGKTANQKFSQTLRITRWRRNG